MEVHKAKLSRYNKSSINHRINFTQLARHSGQYCERSMRLHFEHFTDFASINLPLIQQHGSGHFILALGPTYLPRSGKKTLGVGRYCGAARRSGTAQKALWGLGATLLSVVDVGKRTARHRQAAPLDAVQTPGAAEREAKDISLTDHYAQVVVWQAEKCQALSGYLTADAHFAKAGFIDRVCSASGLQVVSRLRKDARLRYLYTGPATGKPGRPRQYAGRVELSRPDFDHFTMSHQDGQVRIYSAVVNCPFLRRNIKLAYTQFLDADTGLPTPNL